MVTAAALSEFPDEVRQFVTAMIANAKTVEGWAVLEFNDDTECFADRIPYVKRLSDGSVQICDNIEKFFSTIYRFSPEGVWTVREMYSDEPPKPYTFEQCMADASIMFTG